MTLNGVKIMAVELHHFTEFGKPRVLTHNRVDLWRNLCTSLSACISLYRLAYDVVVEKVFAFAISHYSSPDKFLT